MRSKTRENRHPDWQMKRSERGWYYVGENAWLMSSTMITGYMTVFLMFQGISTASVATAILAVKIIDSMDDVIFGFFVDRLKITKWKALKKITGEGKYMPWYRLTFWTFPLATILFFLMPKSLPDAAKIAWFFVTYLLYDLTCTLSEVPMRSMVMTLTESPSERNNILTIKGVCNVLVTVGVNAVISFLISQAVGVPITTVAISGAVVFLILMIPMCFKVKEHNFTLKNVEQEGSQETYSFKDMIKCVVTNKYILIYFLAVTIAAVLCTRMAVEVFIGFYVFNDSMVFTYVMLIGLVPGIILSAFCGKIADRVGKRNLLGGIYLLVLAANLVIYLFCRDSKMMFIVIGGLCAIPNALIAIATTYIAPDTIEYTRYKTGKDCSGIFYSIQSFITKATNGVASALALYILAAFGWKEVQGESFADLAAQGVTQSQTALDALWNVGYLIPLIGYLAAAVLLFGFYRLKDKDAELMGKCNAGMISREECEAQLSRRY